MNESKTWVVNLRHTNEYDVYIGRAVPRRGLKASFWANPFKVEKDMSGKEVMIAYRQYVTARPSMLEKLEELRGKVLACWCKPKPCHGDILVELIESIERDSIC